MTEWFPLEAFANVGEHLAVLRAIESGAVAARLANGMAVEYRIYAGGQSERDAFLTAIASNAARSETPGAPLLSIVGKSSQGGVGGLEQINTLNHPDLMGNASLNQAAITPAQSSQSNGHRRHEQFVAVDYCMDLQRFIGRNHVRSFGQIADAFPSRTEGALRRVLGMLARDGVFLRGYDATGHVWYSLPDLLTAVDKLLDQAPFNRKSLFIMLTNREGTPAELEGLEAILQAVGYPIENRIVSRRPVAQEASS